MYMLYSVSWCCFVYCLRVNVYCTAVTGCSTQLQLTKYINIVLHCPIWDRGGLGAVLHIGRSLVRSQMVSLEFFIDIKSFRSHYGPGVDSASNRNEYQEHFPGVKAAGA